MMSGTLLVGNFAQKAREPQQKRRELDCNEQTPAIVMLIVLIVLIIDLCFALHCIALRRFTSLSRRAKASERILSAGRRKLWA